MEFTLQQLTPENLKMVFDSAMHKVVDVRGHTLNDDGNIEQYGSVQIEADGNQYVVVPMPDNRTLKYIYRTWSEVQEGETEEDQYKVSNAWDSFAINAKFNGRDNFNGKDIWSWTFFYSRLVPDELPLTAKDVVMNFRLFQKEIGWSLRNWHGVETAALS